MISVTILVKNGERKLKEVLEALQGFPEIVVFDTGSTDKTLDIALNFTNVSCFKNEFKGFGPSHNEAASHASYDWILSIDADEVVSPELANEILSLSLDPNSVYEIPFRNYFNGKWIKWCGWHPEAHIRLYNRTKTSFDEAFVHEGVCTDNVKVVKLKYPVFHYPYETVSDFLQKMERYSTLFAKQYVGVKASSPWKATGHAAWSFFKNFFLRRGFLGGYEGMLISFYNAHTAFYKYLKLYEANAHHADVSQDRERQTLQ